MRKFFLGAIFLLLSAPSTSAHDAWIEIDSKNSDMMDTVLSVRIGHAEDQNFYALRAEHVSAMRISSESGSSSFLGEVISGRQARQIELKNTLNSNQIASISTFRAYSSLESNAFNDYVTHEGITPIELDRITSRTVESDGREVYSRHLKAFLPGSSLSCELQGADEPTGLVLEIIPEATPLAECSSTLALRVEFLGVPLQGATLKLIRTDEHAEEIRQETDEEGRAEFEMPREGRWYVHTAWAQPVSDAQYRADYATYFSSFSFNPDPAHN